MPRRPITRLVDLCREIGVEHIQVTELFRRIDRETAAGNDVIVQEFGTFYRKFNRARVRVLNNEQINVPANDRTALRGQRFPATPIVLRINLNGTGDTIGDRPVLFVFPDDPTPNQGTVAGRFRVRTAGGAESEWQVELSVQVSNVVRGENPSFTHSYQYRAEVVDYVEPTFGQSGQFPSNRDNTFEADNPIGIGFVVEAQDTTQVDGRLVDGEVIIIIGTPTRPQSDTLGFQTQVAFEV